MKMKNKHLLLFEAFSAKTISKTINFLNKQIGAKRGMQFTEILKNTLKDTYDLPIDKIDDRYLEYLGKREAEIIKGEKVENPEGIYCLKFWFSIEDGYLGYTYTGNVVKENKPANVSYTGSSNRLTFDDIKSLGITSGQVITLESSNIEEIGIETGDKIIGVFGDNGLLQEAIAYFNKTKDNVYAIQDKSNGSSPSTNDWRKYGKCSWQIITIRRGSYSKSSDNRKLAKYIDDGSDLTLNGTPDPNPTKVEIEVKPKVNITEYNLPMRGKDVKDWNQSFRSITLEGFKKADFSVIFYYDRFVTETKVQHPSEIKKARKELKSGAASLLKNDDIKRENINRYIDRICKNLGFEYEENPLNLSPRHLEKVVIKILRGNLALYSIKFQDSVSKLHGTIDKISKLIMSYDSAPKPLSGDYKEDVENRYESLIGNIKSYYQIDEVKFQDTIRSKFNRVGAELLRSGKEEEAKILLKILSIGDYIIKSLLVNPINTINDLKVILVKIRSIKDLLDQSDIGFTDSILSALSNAHYNDNDMYNAMYNISRREGVEKTNDRINLIEKYIKSIL
jgi:hypothetical protein